MALPEGITTCTVTAGVAVSFSGTPVKSYVSIEPSVFLVHTATGTPLVDFLDELNMAEGVAAQFTLPHTDQPGFQDEAGNAYTNWYYTARVTYSTPSKTKAKAPKVKVFQLVTGQTLVDLDRLPGGAPALPYTAPIAGVSSVNGQTGAVIVDAEPLPARLEETALNATIRDNIDGQAIDALPSTGTYPFTPLVRNHPTATVSVKGIDKTTGAVFAVDQTNANFKRSDNGADWFNITLPAGIPYDQVACVERYGAHVYLAGRPAGGAVEVYRATPVTGNTVYAWTKVHTMKAGSAPFDGELWAGSQYLYAYEYGDPVGGPSAYRSADGVTWETIYTVPTTRHFHSISEDPYVPGSVWIAGGDGQGVSLAHSPNHGAPGSWTVVRSPAQDQVVQISYSPDWIYGACDSKQGTFFVIDRATKAVRLGAPNWHAYIPVPGSTTGETYYQNAYWGAVDPATGIYYCVANDTSVPGNYQGLFYSPKAGQPITLLDKGGPAVGLNGKVFIHNGRLWSGAWHRTALSK